jgi:hypothetical protein
MSGHLGFGTRKNRISERLQGGKNRSGESMNRFQLDKIDAARAQQYEASLTAFKSWLRKNPQVPDCIAVQNLFEEYADFDDGLTETDFDFAYSNLQDRISKQRVPSPGLVTVSLDEN